MRLDRNVIRSPGKYALIKMRKLEEFRTPGTLGHMHHASIEAAIQLLERHGIIDWCDTPETEAFVVRLKDKHAGGALYQYATSAFLDDPEYARDVMDLAKRSGSNHPNCRSPD